MSLRSGTTIVCRFFIGIFCALLVVATRADQNTPPAARADSLLSGCYFDWQSIRCPYAESHYLFEELVRPNDASGDTDACEGTRCWRPDLIAWNAAPGVPAAPSLPDATADTTGPTDKTGYYLLSAIPLIVGVGGLIGIDHRLPNDNSGIWKRSNQLDLEYGVVLTELGGALWLGGEDRLGRTYWQSLDATVFSALTVQGLKYATGRARPSQSANPNDWRQGSCCQSFPSGEVTLQASFVTPFILEYRQQDPWVWGLEALPLYDALARMKTQGHWQTDVLAGWALGTAFGIFADNHDVPFFLSVMPHGVMAGWHTSF